MIIIKTAQFVSLAAERLNFPWKPSLSSWLRDAVNTASTPEFVDSMTDYEKDEPLTDNGKESIIEEAVRYWAASSVPAALKSLDGELMPEFKAQVRSFVQDQFRVDPFPGDADLTPDWTADDLKESFNL